MDLTKKKCVPCEGGEPKISYKDALILSKAIPNWKIVNKHHLIREFKFKDFKAGLKFVNEVGKIAESEGHHPDIVLKWGYVKIKLFTHAIRGLHQNDFIIASKIDKI